MFHQVKKIAGSNQPTLSSRAAFCYQGFVGLMPEYCDRFFLKGFFIGKMI
jgi:hypothetical protein